MRLLPLACSFVALAILSTAAPAQPTPPRTSATAVSARPGTDWRASKLIGVNIYNEQNEKLGSISEIILDPSGRVVGYVIGVGGFLGMGEHDILVPPGMIRFVNEPVRTTAAPTTTPAPTTPTTPAPVTNPPPVTTTTPAPATRTVNEQWYPDHGIMNATKDQLKAMTQFKY